MQCVFTGRTQEALSSLSAADSAVYAKVKGVVLKAYESLKHIDSILEIGKREMGLTWNLPGIWVLTSLAGVQHLGLLILMICVIECCWNSLRTQSTRK